MRSDLKTRLPALILIAVSVGMMAFGIDRGEMRTVFKKAIVICLECIGIG